MDRGFDAREAVVPDVNGNVNENVDVEVNTRVRREMIPAAVPVGRGEPTVARVGTGEVATDTNRESMDRCCDAGEAAVPDVNGNMHGNVDVDVIARVTREMSPAAVPVGLREPTVAGVGTGEGEESGMILPPQSERWLSGISGANPSTQRIRSFVRTSEIMFFLLGLATLISLIIFTFDVITMKTFWPLTVAVLFSAGGHCALLIQRLRYLYEADQVLGEIMEARAAGNSNRVIPKEERRLLFQYFTLRPSTNPNKAFICADAPSGASAPSGARTPSGDDDERERRASPGRLSTIEARTVTRLEEPRVAIP